MSSADGPRPSYELIPRGPHVAPGAAMPAAAGGGRLAGELAEDGVRTWFEQEDGRVLVMCPRRFRARWDPLEVMDETGRAVARGGELVSVQGGYRKPDPDFPDAEPVFAAAAIAARP
jgi:hypothetical protein